MPKLRARFSKREPGAALAPAALATGAGLVDFLVLTSFGILFARGKRPGFCHPGSKRDYYCILTGKMAAEKWLKPFLLRATILDKGAKC
jgi:hypothetical protein